MKSILYVGATLMIGASIYGFVDYTKTRSKKEFKNMYTDKEVTQPAVEEKLSAANTGKIETPVDDKKATVSNTTTDKRSVAKVRKQKRRTFNTRLFSRGALDEKYIKEEKINPQEPKTKTEPGKIVRKDPDGENKEQ